MYLKFDIQNMNQFVNYETILISETSPLCSTEISSKPWVMTKMLNGQGNRLSCLFVKI